VNSELTATLEETYPSQDPFLELHAYINRGIDLINAMPEGPEKEEARDLMAQQIRVASQKLGDLEAELRRLLDQPQRRQITGAANVNPVPEKTPIRRNVSPPKPPK
jgi:hypothetical protein